MISKMSHATIYVIDQDQAIEFYRDKLGFRIINDVSMDGGFRWVTVAPKDQSDFEIVLMGTQAGFMFEEEASNQLRALISTASSARGCSTHPTARLTYDELSALGVEFLSPPAERPYGIEAIFKDNSGNWFSLTQHKDD